jgi:hypothetical protein
MNNNTELQHGAEIAGETEMADERESAASTQVMIGDGAAIEIPLPVSTVGIYQPDTRNVRPSATPSQPAGRLPEQTPAQSVAAPATVRDPELYAAWKTHIENGFTNNQLMFQKLLNGFMNPYWTTVWMYRILFGLGVASFLVAAGLSVSTGKEGYTLIFGGLSALSLLAYFFNRPLQALEENLQFITWLGLIYNSYWTRLVYLNSQPDVQKELQGATDDAIQRIKELMEAHAQSSGRRQTLSKP